MATRKPKQTSQPGVMTKAGYVSADVETDDAPEYVIVELRHESPVAFAASAFTAPAAAAPQAESLNATLEKFDIAAVRSHFGFKQKELRARVEVAATLPPDPDPAKFADKGMTTEFMLSGFVQVIPKKPADAKKLAAALNRKQAVRRAYVATRPVPAMATGASTDSRNFEPSQGYLYQPPVGIGAAQVWSSEGAKGRGVTICDIEGNWNRRHEDLPTGIPLIGGTPISEPETDRLRWANHGTAVLGMMVAQPSAKGCVGISHEAKAAVHSFIIEGVSNPALAIYGATKNLNAGDVILIELQRRGPNDKYVAMQYWEDIFLTIVAATEKGITVVEAAGNGDENFDLAVFNETGLQRDSGAIVVGAGVPPTNHIDFEGWPGLFTSYERLGPPRSRLWFSNYGKIVNVQGWGWHVTTLGYGDAQGGDSENRWYTLRFSGTSSASPIVAGAVACIQGHAKATLGSPLSPARVRELLMRTGTPQEESGAAPLTQNIGPLPNLARAMKEI